MKMLYVSNYVFADSTSYEISENFVFKATISDCNNILTKTLSGRYACTILMIYY